MTETPSRPASHTIGDVGETEASRIFIRWGWTADFIKSDYGEDLDCNIFIKEKRTELHFRCQVKSTKNPKHFVKKLRSGDFSVSINISNAKIWIRSFFPVLVIIYDHSSEKMYWTNASEQIGEKVETLSQGTITLKISCSAVLEKNRAEIEKSIQRYFGSILRLSSPVLICTVFPILMPGYRALPFNIVHALEKKNIFNAMNYFSTTQNMEKLPSWTTTIKTLAPSWLSGWEVQSRADNLDQFLIDLQKMIESFRFDIDSNGWIDEFKLQPSEWISCVHSPVILTSDKIENLESKNWQKELIDWWSYSLIGSHLFSDYEYAFKVPNGFLSQVARQARSWETFHHVNPKEDIAIELFASVATTPSYKKECETYRQQMLSQVYPWVCENENITELHEMLSSIGLDFRRIDFQTNNKVSAGVICKPFFEPDIGIFTITNNWNEFVQNSIRKRLEESSLLNSLPGKQGSEELTEAVILKFGDAMCKPPDHIMISERNFIKGHPIDHSRRLIFAQRFRKTENVDENYVRQKLTDCSDQMNSSLTNPDQVKLGIDIFDTIESMPIYRLSLSWRPDLEESSSKSYTRFSNVIIHAFDEIFPRTSLDKNQMQSTYDILRCYGSLHFNT